MSRNREFRYLGTCKFCGNQIHGTHHNKFQSHQRWCLKNPNRDKTVKQARLAFKRGSEVANANKQLKAAKLNEKHERVLQCKKCTHDYTIWVSDRDFERGSYPKYCSRSCANSRDTLVFKKKISDSVSKEREHVCPKCKTTFMHKGTNIHHTYCDSCYKKVFGFERGCARINHKVKATGVNRPKIGNDMPLHRVDCLGCKKSIWCKTSDDVYCYDCAKKLGKVVHQLYSPHGKKLTSSATKEKLKQLASKRVKDGTHKGWMSRHEHSYSELFWMKVLDNNKIQYEEEAHVPGYLYRLDFKITLPNGRVVDLEIDGKQHSYSSRKEHDQIRDQHIRELGYLVYRISWNNMTKKLGKMRMKAKINQFLWWLSQVSK